MNRPPLTRRIAQLMNAAQAGLAVRAGIRLATVQRQEAAQ
jgi:hypothetical protein